MRRPTEIAASALVLFAAGYALWPPGRVYWTALVDVVGPIVTMGVVFLVAALIGATIARVGDVRVGSLAAGGIVAYVAGMVLVEVLMTPESPAHLYMYGFYLLCALGGAALARGYPGVRPLGDRVSDAS